MNVKEQEYVNTQAKKSHHEIYPGTLFGTVNEKNDAKKKKKFAENIGDTNQLHLFHPLKKPEWKRSFRKK
jgi:hypothetical protein